MSAHLHQSSHRFHPATAFRALAGIVFIAFALLATPLDAKAQSSTTTQSFPVSASCGGGGQTCDTIPEVTVTTGGALEVQFTTASSHCSDIRVDFLVDGQVAGGTSFLGAGQQSPLVDLGTVSAGTHRIGVRATGRTGGCNSGALVSWAGTLLVVTEPPGCSDDLAGGNANRTRSACDATFTYTSASEENGPVDMFLSEIDYVGRDWDDQAGQIVVSTEGGTVAHFFPPQKSFSGTFIYDRNLNPNDPCTLVLIAQQMDASGTVVTQRRLPVNIRPGIKLDFVRGRVTVERRTVQTDDTVCGVKPDAEVFGKGDPFVEFDATAIYQFPQLDDFFTVVPGAPPANFGFMVQSPRAQIYVRGGIRTPHLRVATADPRVLGDGRLDLPIDVKVHDPGTSTQTVPRFNRNLTIKPEGALALGSVTVAGRLRVDGNLYVRGNLSVGGGIVGTGRIFVEGNVIVRGPVDIGIPNVSNAICAAGTVTLLGEPLITSP